MNKLSKNQRCFAPIIIFGSFLVLFFIFGRVGSANASGNVFYSVGQNTFDHKTGAPTITIAAGVATFSVAQTATNMGVGDKISYGTAGATSTVYISAKQSSLVWNVVTATGSQPIATTSSAVLKISHAFNSLTNALPSGAGGAKGASYLNTTDLVAGNYILNIPCYYDSGSDLSTTTISGWTTGSGNYIKVYTPNNTAAEVNQSQRHNGRWNTDVYNIVVSNENGIYVSTPNVRIDGLQISITAANSNHKGMYLAVRGGAADVYVSNNIVKGAGAGAASYHSGIAVHDASGGGTIRVWNNIVYNFSSNTNFGLELCSGGFNYYAYNNTLYNNNTGAWNDGYLVLAKNNIAYGNVDNYSGTYSASSTNNLSGPAQSDAPGSNARQNMTVSFLGTATSSLHLSFSDTGAKDYGLDLSSDKYLPISTDVDGQARTGTWDIGADEYVALTLSSVATSSVYSGQATVTWTTNNTATSTVKYGLTSAYGSSVKDNSLVTSHSIVLPNLTPNTVYHFQVSSTDAPGVYATSTDYTFTTGSTKNIFYSVGQNTFDHKTGTPTITIVDGVATFSEAQIAANMGVGDKISYGYAGATTTVYISGKQSNLVWNVITATGGQPTATTTAAVLKISHVFGSLQGAITGFSGANYLNTTNLVPGSYIMNFPCYYDSGPDTTKVTVTGTTGLNNYFKIYTPNNTATEVNASQRHSGKWDNSKYRIEVTVSNDQRVVETSADYVKVDGLQVNVLGSGANEVGGIGMKRNGVSGSLWASNNIITGTVPTNLVANGIIFHDWTNTSQNFNVYAWNNIVYNFNRANVEGQGIYTTSGNLFAYNNTVFGCVNGFSDGHSTQILKNNLSYNNVDNYRNSYSASSTNNLSGPTQSDAPGSNQQNSKIVYFYSTSTLNFHLLAGDINAKNQGLDLSSDKYLPISVDVDGQTRTGAWDIGADEYVPLNIFAVATSSVTFNSATVTWTTDNLSTSTGQYGLTTGYGSASSSSSFVTSHVINLRGLTPNSPYHFRVISTDAFGVVATSTDYTFRTPVGPDIIPPVITFVSTSTTAYAATITWTTDEDATSSVRYGTSISYGLASSSQVFASSSPPHSINLSQLATSTAYHFQIISTDVSGNQATSSDYTFTTLPSAFTITASAGANGTVTPSGVTTKNYGDSQAYTIAISTAGYHVSNILVDGSPIGTSSLTYTFTNITANHTISATFNVNGSIPVTTYTIGGTISGLSGTVILRNNGGDNLSLSTNGSFVFATAINDGSSYAVTVSTNPSGQTCTVSSGSGTVSGANITGISVSCATNSTPPSGGGGGGGAPAPAPDITPPGLVSNLLASSSERAITLTWVNPTDSDFAGVKIFHKPGSPLISYTDPLASLIYQGKAQIFVDVNLTAGQEYYYSVYSYDAKPNYSVAKTIFVKVGSGKIATSTPVVPIIQNPVVNPGSGSSGMVVTSLIGASSAIVNQVTRDEAAELLANAVYSNLTPAEKTIYLKIIAISKKTLSDRTKIVFAYFIHVGTPTTRILGAGERGGSIASFGSAFGYLPETLADWQDVLKVGNGRWTEKKSSPAENSAKIQFKKIYGRASEMTKQNDNAAVTVMAYGLRPAQRNTNSEKTAILSFKYIFKKNPTSAADWDIVRAIAYSGAKR